jgi:cytochrome c
MDSFELNKIAGAVLSVGLFVMGMGFLSELLISSPAPRQQGFALPVPEVTAAAPAAAASAAPAEPLPVRLAAADAARGETAFRRCSACHTNDKAAANRVGPAMWGVVERAKASVPGFAYSDAAKAQAAAGDKWGFAQLDAFIENPKGYMPGTKMAFAGIANARERADLLAYLRTLSDAPVPLPQ